MMEKVKTFFVICGYCILGIIGFFMLFWTAFV